MDGIDHCVQRRTKPQLRLFRIEILDQGGGALNICEQNRDLLALALKQGTRVQDARHETLPKMNRGRDAVPVIEQFRRPAALRVRTGIATEPVGELDGRATIAARLE